DTVFPGEFLIIGQTQHDVGEEHIEDGTDDKRTQDSDRHITLGILGFLRRCGDGVKSYIGEEYYRCSADNTAESKFTEYSCVCRDVGLIVFRLDIGPPEDHEGKNYSDFQGYNNGVSEC